MVRSGNSEWATIGPVDVIANQVKYFHSLFDAFCDEANVVEYFAYLPDLTGLTDVPVAAFVTPCVDI